MPPSVWRNLSVCLRTRRDGLEPEAGDTEMRVQYDARLHGPRDARGFKEPLTTAFLRKYIHYAKSRIK
jgi:hypothetical protein